MDFDDEPTETPASPPKAGHPSTLPQSESVIEVAPPKPPRPIAPEQQAENTLKEAFPSIDAVVVKAVLRASGGKVEPAFNALLGQFSWILQILLLNIDVVTGMSDPDAAEPTPPIKPPRPQGVPTGPTSTEEDQLAADERYARQLAEHYNGAASYEGPPRSMSATRRSIPREAARRENAPRREDFDDDRDRNFFDGKWLILKDKLPLIRNVR